MTATTRPPRQRGPRRLLERRLTHRSYRDGKLLIWPSLIATVERRADLNVRIGRWSRLVPSAHSWCLRCKTSWFFVRAHETRYSDSSGCFPLCEKCWGDLRPMERLPYYWQLLEVWVSQSCADYSLWPAIHDAVMEGK